MRANSIVDDLVVVVNVALGWITADYVPAPETVETSTAKMMRARVACDQIVLPALVVATRVVLPTLVIFEVAVVAKLTDEEKIFVMYTHVYPAAHVSSNVVMAVVLAFFSL